MADEAKTVREESSMMMTTENDESQEMITASIYPDTDVRCKKYSSHINPVIESELVKHKIAIE